MTETQNILISQLELAITIRFLTRVFNNNTIPKHNEIISCDVFIKYITLSMC